MPDDCRSSRVPRIAALAAAILTLLSGAAARAEEIKQVVLGIAGADDRRPVDAGAWPWVALGQVNREIGGHCTGVLIAADRVLTAAHCLYNFTDRRWTIPMEVHFVAGYDRGEYREHARAKRFIVSPDWEAGQAMAGGNIGNDWAIIELERSLSIRPIEVSALDFDEIKAASQDGELTIAAYNGDFAEILTRHQGCDLAGQSSDRRLVLHECDATYGASGAPLLLVTPAGAEIVGVQSAVIETQSGRIFGAAVPIATIRAEAGL